MRTQLRPNRCPLSGSRFSLSEGGSMSRNLFSRQSFLGEHSMPAIEQAVIG